MRTAVLCVLWICAVLLHPPCWHAADPVHAADDTSASSNLFSQRLLPLLKSDKPSSCSECHPTGVAVSDYLRESEADTFAALKQAGLIDTQQPDKSRILQFISRSPEKKNPLLEKVRAVELQAFRDWIRSAVKNPLLLQAKTNQKIGTELAPEIIRHARSDRVLASFVDNIWSEMGRCVNCHHPERNRSKVGQHGLTLDDVNAISWIVPHDPAATLQQLVNSGNIDLTQPDQSPVLTKPAGLSDHKGGPKFLPGSASYQNFLTFLRDYAAVKNGSYQAVSDLPQPQTEIRLLSEQQMRITDIPRQYAGMTLQINLHHVDSDSGQVSPERWATGISRVNPDNGIWQNPILVTAPVTAERAARFRRKPELPTGQYQVRILIDQHNKLKTNPETALDDTDLVGSLSIHGEWKPGYQPPRIIAFPKSTP